MACAANIPPSFVLCIYVPCLQQENEEKTAEQKIVYRMPLDEPREPANKQEFVNRKVYNDVNELSLLPFTPPNMTSYVLGMLSGTFKVGSNRHSQCAAAAAGDRRQDETVWVSTGAGVCTDGQHSRHGGVSMHSVHSNPITACCLHKRRCIQQVFQYVVTVMVALMVMQHSVERYWILQGTTNKWQDLLFVVFIS
jgi:hypothetical protein